MREHTTESVQHFSNIAMVRRTLKGASVLAMTGVMLMSASAIAQTNDEGKKKEGAASAADIVVVGTRASLQSAINRKKIANTVVDSIVADDIGCHVGDTER